MYRFFRTILMLILTSGVVIPLYAQRKNFEYKFYGFVRGDLYYNSRQNTEAFDGLFYLLPKDELLDTNGKDLNATPSSGFYTFITRLGMDIKGPDIGSAKSSARIETDFGGVQGSFFLIRMRHAYAKLDWENGSSVLLGQTWHPLFGDIMPDMLNVSTGAPFQPFNRSPQFLYQYTKNSWKMKAAAVYQFMYLSTGPFGKSVSYQKNGILPELCLGVDYTSGGLLVGIGAEMLSLKPRLESIVDNHVYSVDERITTFSYEAHAKYVNRKLTVAAKTLLASNLNHLSLLGGYGISNIDPVTGEQKYTSTHHSTTWVNAVYGERWKGGIFAGYTKALGTSKALVPGTPVYGLGMDLDQLLTTSAQFSYNLPHWKVGLEYQVTTGWYGETNFSDGKIENTHDVVNHRVCGLFTYFF